MTTNHVLYFLNVNDGTKDTIKNLIDEHKTYTLLSSSINKINIMTKYLFKFYGDTKYIKK